MPNSIQSIQSIQSIHNMEKPWPTQLWELAPNYDLVFTRTITQPSNKDVSTKYFFYQVFDIGLSFVRPGAWNDDIKELETFFNENDLPSGPVQLYPWLTINNVQSFVDNNLIRIKAQNGNPTFKHYLERMQKLVECMKSSNTLSPPDTIIKSNFMV